jgi:HD-like signal output (HDOD) protein
MSVPSDAGALPASSEKLIPELRELISLPDVYVRLQQVIQSEQASLDQVAEVLTLDPALVARLLRIANSALYNFPSSIDTVTRAVTLLGVRQVHDLVLASSVVSSFAGVENALLDMNTFWYRSVQSGILVRTLAEGAGMRDGESLFVRGLLHDLGHLVLYHHYPEQCRAALAAANDDYAALPAAEQRLIGCDANSLTAELMSVWRLPEVFQLSYTYLAEPQCAPRHQREIGMLHIATALAHGVDTDLLVDQVLERISPRIWKLVQLPPEVAHHALDAASLEMVDTMYRVLSGEE